MTDTEPTTPTNVLPPSDTTTVDVEAEFADKTLKDLQKMLAAMDFVGADVFTSKNQAVKVIMNLRAKQAMEEEKLAAAGMGGATQQTVKGPKGETLIVNPTAPTAKDKRSEKSDENRWAGKAGAMKKKLWSQKLVQFMIPLGFGEKRGAYESVILNGYRLNIMKGVRVEIPEQIADLLADSYQMTAEAGKDFDIERSPLVTETLK